MKAETILKLVDAGFSRDEILKLEDSKEPDQVPDQAPKDPPAASPEDPKPETPPAPSGVTMSDDQFRALLQQLNIQGASMDVPPEADISKKLGEHFKDVMIGK